MKVGFVLPGPMNTPSGGFRIVYEYADRLAARGHEVTVYHNLILPKINYNQDWLIKRLIYCLRQKWPQDFQPGWFSFRHSLRTVIVPETSDLYVEDDVVVASSWPTAYGVAGLRPERKKLYLIQGYEVWQGEVDNVHNSYKLGLGNIAVAGWLKEIIEKSGAKVAAHISNSIDFSRFFLTSSSEDRDPYSVAMVYHTLPLKGAEDGLTALKLVKEQFPQLQATLFSIFPEPAGLPAWIQFVFQPSQSAIRDIYNSHSVFLSSSWEEGFGLPGAEALACGCALVTTDSKGVRDYAVNGQTALLSPPKNPQLLAKNVISLLQNPSLRTVLAQHGYQNIRQFSWDAAVERLESLMTGL